jgi:F420-dependent oxidoreductase-like protein
MPGVKLGAVLGYWGAQPPTNAEELVLEAERLGYDSVWTAEAYGSDALTPLAWWGARTSRIKLGTDIVQLSARTPAATAMAAMTLDHLSGGRFILGLGASGPQVVEGWYGQPYPRPLERTREYIEIVRKILAREEPLTYDGAQYQLPHRGGMDLGKPVKSIVHPLRADLPIYLAAEGPKNVALAAEVADGWLGLFFSPAADEYYRACLAEGFARPRARHAAEDFEVAMLVPTIIGDDIEACASAYKPMLALYMGGMGARSMNFHYDVFCRMGHQDVADKVQALYLEGRKDEAVAAIPTTLVEDMALVGPLEKIRDDLERWKETAMTTMLVSGDVSTLRTVAELVL